MIEQRLLTATDVPAYHAAFHGEFPRLKATMFWPDDMITPDGIANWIATGRVWGLFEGEAIVGALWMHEPNRFNRSVGLGAWIAASHEGRGVMRAAVGTLIEYAISELGMNRIEGSAAEGNTRSIALLERLGFQYEGREREGSWHYDHYEDRLTYALLAGEWRCS